MPDKLYQRTTRLCALNDLRADHLAALRDHAEKYKLGALDATLCGETTSTKRKTGFLDRLSGGAPITYTSVVITPVWLLWVVSDTKQPPTAMSARLSEVEVNDSDQRIMLDRGLDVLARPTDVALPGSYFLGLSDEEAGDRLRAGVMDAVKQAHNG